MRPINLRRVPAMRSPAVIRLAFILVVLSTALTVAPGNACELSAADCLRLILTSAGELGEESVPDAVRSQFVKYTFLSTNLGSTLEYDDAQIAQADTR